MKKILLLSITSLVMLMADFTLIGDQLSPVVDEPAVEPGPNPTIPEASNPYLEPINIPTYDSSDPSHLLITVANKKWTSTNLNNPSYKHFYVESGSYSGTTITLTADGTSSESRTISLYNGNNIHPASLNETQQANVRLKWDNADYWTIDRLSFLSYQDETDIRWLDNNSNHNILNRINLKDYYYGIIITGSSSYNSIQNSYIDHMTHAGRLSDNVGIALQSWGASSNSPVYSFHNKIINNDIRNAGDGIQLVRKQGQEENSFYDGTIIDSNRIWNDSDVYTNGDYANNGYNPNGQYQIGENAMDFKQGSADPTNPVIVSNNKMWGYQEGDSTAGGSQSGGSGAAVPLHFEAQNIKFNKNIIFDSMDGFASSGVFSGQTYAIKNCEFTNNVMYHMYYINPVSRREYPHFFYEGQNIKYEHNSIIDINAGVNGGYWFRLEDSGAGMTFKNNLMIDVNGGTSANNGATVDNNYYYNTDSKFPTTGTNVIDPDYKAMGDYTFKYEIFTTSPKSKTLIGIVSTLDSPHYGVAGSSISQSTTP